VRGHRKHPIASVLILLMCEAAFAADAPHAMREDQLKAGYVFNFAKFVDWPNLGAAENLTVCFVGGAGVREAFTVSTQGKQVGAHPVTLRAIAGKSIAGCHLVFIAADAAPAPDLMSGAGTASVLSVGEEHDFIHKGGMIELFTEDNRLRFNINLENARRAGLKISSALLELASHVEESGK
jgi:YfiR/HmsC-like